MIGTVVDTIAPGSDYNIEQPSTDSLQVNITSVEAMYNTSYNSRELFFQSQDIKYVVFVFNTDNPDTKNSQMNSLAGLDFSKINSPVATGSNSLFIIIIVILFIALLVAALFLLKK